MFTPKWKKEAKHLYKGSKKFIHYKRDLLELDRIEEIESRRDDLKKAWKQGDREASKEAGKQLQSCCEKSLPRYKGPDALTENVEVFFVAIVIALGLRAYYLQPFRIPTGSMRPTLNGIIGHVQSKDKWPAAPVRWMQQASHGRDYLSVSTEATADRIVDIKDGQVWHFFTRTNIIFASGRKVSVPGSRTAFLETIDYAALSEKFQRNITANNLGSIEFPPNFTIAEGYINTGDLVLVDKFSYHFRRPKAGEVFVFDTREIKQIQAGPNPGSHYIKRLIGTPGDTIELRGGTPTVMKRSDQRGNTILLPVHNGALLYRNGEKMKQDGVVKVESQQNGYGGYQAHLRLEGRPVTLANKPSSGKSEYWAMGDNSYNSSDSRDWGTVKEFNVMGPALFTLWPFGSGHWGLIH